MKPTSSSLSHFLFLELARFQQLKLIELLIGTQLYVSMATLFNQCIVTNYSFQ